MWESVSGLSFSGFHVFSGKLQMWKDSQVIFWCRMQVGNSTFKVSSDHFIFLRFWFHPWREAPESPLNAEFGAVTSAVGSWNFQTFIVCPLHPWKCSISSLLYDHGHIPRIVLRNLNVIRNHHSTAYTRDMNHNQHPFDMLLADTTIVGLWCCASFKPRQVNSCVSSKIGVCKWLWTSWN